MPILDPGTLWPLAVQRTEHALKSGALQPIDTVSERIEQAHVNFIVRTISSLWQKSEARPGNPFLPYDEAMFVADMSDTYVCLLNKFNVIDNHLLFVTRHFEDQALALGEKDFAVVLMALREIDGLVFYNGGVIAGASQPHRHLQLVPLPFLPGERLPVNSLINTALQARNEQQVLPFRYAVASIPNGWVEHPVAAARDMEACYLQMLATAGVTTGTVPDAATPVAPNNLLVTREWMLLVPRSRECWKGVSVNALGFSGSLVVRDARQMQAVRTHGPMNVLCSVAFPR